MKNYSEMTDFEINVAVAKLLPYLVAFDDNKNPITLEPNCAPAYTGSDYDQIPFDPCNSWADAGPIIQFELISLNPVMKGWCAGSDDDAEIYFSHDNPLRAAMIVFLMMQESK